MELGLWCLTLLSTIFQLYRGGQFDRWKPDYPEKTTDLPQITDRLHHIKWYTSPWASFELTTFVVIGTDCIGSCKSIWLRPRRPLLIKLMFFKYHTVRTVPKSNPWYSWNIAESCVKHQQSINQSTKI